MCPDGRRIEGSFRAIQLETVAQFQTHIPSPNPPLPFADPFINFLDSFLQNNVIVLDFLSVEQIFQPSFCQLFLEFVGSTVEFVLHFQCFGEILLFEGFDVR